jgi:thiol-disulfide isomerase/thioredoxin
MRFPVTILSRDCKGAVRSLIQHAARPLQDGGLWALVFLATSAGPPLFAQQQVTIAQYVQLTTRAGDYGAADKALAQYRAARGITPEYLDAFSRIGRARLASHNLDAAEKNAQDVLRLCEEQLKHRKLDADPQLPLALGAAIEVHAQALAEQNRRDEAVVFLHDELAKWQSTSIRDRIQKNINLLTLEGKPAPILDVSTGIGSRKPLPLSAHRGHPVLLFLWAHWCPDCKDEVNIVKRLMTTYGPRGLVVVAPTQHYGYVAQGDPAPPAVETKYIGDVFAKYYSGLGSVEIPLSEANFARFGVSTTPTMVLVDGQGIVRLYNPGAASYQLLASKIEPLLNGDHKIEK